MKILLVDDEPDIVTSVKEGLTRKGFEVDGYTNPIEALKNYKNDTYNFILLDIKMPEFNGFQLYREIRKRDDSGKVFFMTAHENYRAAFLKAFPEFDDQRFIKKPTTLSNLVNLMSDKNQASS